MSIVRFYWSYSTDGRSFFVLRGSRGGDPPPAAPAGNHLILWGATTRRATVLPCRLVILSRRRRIRMLPSPGDEGTDPSACGLRMTENGCASPVPGRPLIRPCGAPSPLRGEGFAGGQRSARLRCGRSTAGPPRPGSPCGPCPPGTPPWRPRSGHRGRPSPRGW